MTITARNPSGRASRLRCVDARHGPVAPVRRTEARRHGPRAGVRSEACQGTAFPASAAPASDEDAEEHLLGPRAKVGAALVLVREAKCALDGVLDDVVGRRRVAAKPQSPSAEVGDEFDEAGAKLLLIAGRDGAAARTGQAQVVKKGWQKRGQASGSSVDDGDHRNAGATAGPWKSLKKEPMLSAPRVLPPTACVSRATPGVRPGPRKASYDRGCNLAPARGRRARDPDCNRATSLRHADGGERVGDLGREHPPVGVRVGARPGLSGQGVQHDAGARRLVSGAGCRPWRR